MKSIIFTLCFILTSSLVKAVDPNPNMDKDASDRHSKTSMIRHLTHHLDELNRNQEDLLQKLNNPDTSMEEKRDLTSQLDVVQRKKSSIQTQVENLIKDGRKDREMRDIDEKNKMHMEKMRKMHMEKLHKRHPKFENSEL